MSSGLILPIDVAYRDNGSAIGLERLKKQVQTNIEQTLKLSDAFQALLKYTKSTADYVTKLEKTYATGVQEIKRFRAAMHEAVQENRKILDGLTYGQKAMADYAISVSRLTADLKMFSAAQREALAALQANKALQTQTAATRAQLGLDKTQRQNLANLRAELNLLKQIEAAKGQQKLKTGSRQELANIREELKLSKQLETARAKLQESYARKLQMNKAEELAAYAKHALMREEIRLEKKIIDAQARGHSSLEKKRAELQKLVAEQKKAITVSQKLVAVTNTLNQATASLRAGMTALGANFGIYTSGTILAAAATYGMISQIKMMVSTGAQFTSELARVGAVMQLTEYQMKTMSDTSIQLAASSRYTGTQVSQAFREMGMAGLSYQASMAGIRAVLSLASIGNMDFAEATDIATNVTYGFNLATSELGRVVDVMAKTVTNSNQDIKQLGNTMSYAAPIASAFGVSLELTAAMTEVLANSGIKASRAGTALRRTLTAMFGDSEKTTAQFAELDVYVNELAGDMDKELLRVLKALNKATAGATMNVGNLTKAVGLYAAPGFLKLVAAADEGVGSLEDIYKATQDVDGAAYEMQKRIEDVLTVDWQILQSAIEAVRLGFFNLYEHGLREVVQGVSAFVQGVAENKDVILALNETLKTTIKNLGLMLAALGGLLIVGALAKGIFGAAAALKVLVTGLDASGKAAGRATRSLSLFSGLIKGLGVGIALYAISGLVGAMMDLGKATSTVSGNLRSMADASEALKESLGYDNIQKENEALAVRTAEILKGLSQMQEQWKINEELLDQEYERADAGTDSVKIIERMTEAQAKLKTEINSTTDQYQALFVELFKNEQRQIQYNKIVTQLELDKTKAQLSLLRGSLTPEERQRMAASDDAAARSPVTYKAVTGALNFFGLENLDHLGDNDELRRKRTLINELTAEIDKHIQTLNDLTFAEDALNHANVEERLWRQNELYVKQSMAYRQMVVDGRELEGEVLASFQLNNESVEQTLGRYKAIEEGYQSAAKTVYAEAARIRNVRNRQDELTNKKNPTTDELAELRELTEEYSAFEAVLAKFSSLRESRAENLEQILELETKLYKSVTEFAIGIARIEGRSHDEKILQRELELFQLEGLEAQWAKMRHAAEDVEATEKLQLALMKEQGQTRKLLQIARDKELADASESDLAIIKETHAMQDSNAQLERELKLRSDLRKFGDEKVDEFVKASQQAVTWLELTGQSTEALALKNEHELMGKQGVAREIVRLTQLRARENAEIEHATTILQAYGHEYDIRMLQRRRQLSLVSGADKEVLSTKFAADDEARTRELRSRLYEASGELALAKKARRELEQLRYAPTGEDRDMLDEIYRLEDLTDKTEKADKAIQSLTKTMGEYATILGLMGMSSEALEMQRAAEIASVTGLARMIVILTHAKEDLNKTVEHETTLLRLQGREYAAMMREREHQLGGINGEEAKRLSELNSAEDVARLRDLRIEVDEAGRDLDRAKAARRALERLRYGPGEEQALLDEKYRLEDLEESTGKVEKATKALMTTMNSYAALLGLVGHTAAALAVQRAVEIAEAEEQERGIIRLRHAFEDLQAARELASRNRSLSDALFKDVVESENAVERMQAMSAAGTLSDLFSGFQSEPIISDIDAIMAKSGETLGDLFGDLGTYADTVGEKISAAFVSIQTHAADAISQIQSAVLQLQAIPGTLGAPGAAPASPTAALAAAPTTGQLPGVDRRLVDRVNQMVAAARAEGVNLTIGSGYRSPEEQRRIYEANQRLPVSQRKAVAKPGSSQHNFGRAVDVQAQSGAEAQGMNWMMNNAEKFNLWSFNGNYKNHIHLEMLEMRKAAKSLIPVATQAADAVGGIVSAGSKLAGLDLSTTIALTPVAGEPGLTTALKAYEAQLALVESFGATNDKISALQGAGGFDDADMQRSEDFLKGQQAARQALLLHIKAVDAYQLKALEETGQYGADRRIGEEELKALEDQFGTTSSALREYAQLQLSLERLLANGAISQDKFNQTMEDAALDIISAQGPMEAYWASLKGGMQTFEEVSVDAFEQFRTTLIDSLVEGKFEAGAFFDFFKRKLAEVAVNTIMVNFVGNIAGIVGNSALGAAGSFLFGGKSGGTTPRGDATTSKVGVAGGGSSSMLSGFSGLTNWFGGNSMGASAGQGLASFATKQGMMNANWAGAAGGMASVPNWAFGLGGIGGSMLGTALFNNKGYSGIGSSIGAAAGTMGASALGGAMMGAAAMTGPVGIAIALIGGLLGGAAGGGIGSLFGGSKPKTPAINMDVSGGTLRSTWAQSWEDMESTNKALETANELLSGYAKQLGTAAETQLKASNYTSTMLRPDDVEGYLADRIGELVRDMVKATANERIAGQVVNKGLYSSVIGQAMEAAGSDPDALVASLAAARELFDTIRSASANVFTPATDAFISDSEHAADVLWSLMQTTKLAGEAMTDSLSRVVNTLQIANDAFFMMGSSAASLDPAARVTAGQKILDAGGGYEKLMPAMAAYYENFYTPDERDARSLTTANSQVSSVFADLGIAVPATRAAFRQIVEGLDPLTDAGAKTFAALMGVSEAMDYVFEAASKDWQGVGDSLTSTIKGLKDSLQTEDEIVANYLSLLEKAKGGDGLAAQELSTEVGRYLETLKKQLDGDLEEIKKTSRTEVDYKRAAQTAENRYKDEVKLQIKQLEAVQSLAQIMEGNVLADNTANQLQTSAVTIASEAAAAANGYYSAAALYSANQVYAVQGGTASVTQALGNLGATMESVMGRANKTWDGRGSNDTFYGGGFAAGGIATGPKSGYSALLHGTEAVIPLENGSIPVTLMGGALADPYRTMPGVLAGPALVDPYRTMPDAAMRMEAPAAPYVIGVSFEEMIAELKGLRSEVANLRGDTSKQHRSSNREERESTSLLRRIEYTGAQQ